MATDKKILFPKCLYDFKEESLYRLCQHPCAVNLLHLSWATNCLAAREWDTDISPLRVFTRIPERWIPGLDESLVVCQKVIGDLGMSWVFRSLWSPMKYYRSTFTCWCRELLGNVTILWWKLQLCRWILHSNTKSPKSQNAMTYVKPDKVNQHQGSSSSSSSSSSRSKPRSPLCL